MLLSYADVWLGGLGLVRYFMMFDIHIVALPCVASTSKSEMAAFSFILTVGWGNEWRRGGKELSLQGLWKEGLVLTLYWWELSCMTPHLPMCFPNLGEGEDTFCRLTISAISSRFYFSEKVMLKFRSEGDWTLARWTRLGRWRMHGDGKEIGSSWNFRS